MRTELPVCKRCCFCMPLRYGLITWGYLKLIAGIFVSIALTLTLYNVAELAITYNSKRHMHDIIVLSVILAFLLTDVVLNALFVVGGHQKNVKLLRVYYIYNVVTWTLMFLLVIVCFFLMLPTLSPRYIISFRNWIFLLNLCSSFISIILQTYFLLLLRSEIIKLRSNCEFRFVNNAAEAECTMKYEQEPNEEKRTQDIYKKETCVSTDSCEKTCLSNGSCHMNQAMNDDEI